MVSVLCVRFGEAYGRKYVEVLRNMVSRHLTIPYEFVCLTDDPIPIEGVRSIVQPSCDYKKGWWYKAHMFDPSLDLKNTILYFDLDVVIHKNIDKLAVPEKGKILGIRDFNRKFNVNWRTLNSSIMCWQHKWHKDLWKDFDGHKARAMRFPGDQDWIFKRKQKHIQFYPDEWIQSYKWETRNRRELAGSAKQRNFTETDNNVRVETDCCVSVFHGYPKPDAVQDQFIIDNWR